MKNYITALLLLVFTITGLAQTVVPSGSPNQVTDFKGGVKVEKTLNLPVTDAEPFPGQDKLGQVRISPTDSIVRYFNGVEWLKVTSEENDYVTKNELQDSVSLVRQFALDKDTLRVPYTGATKSVNLGEGHALIAHFIGAGYAGVASPSEVPAWLSVKNPVIPATGSTQTVLGVYNSAGVRSLYVFVDDQNRHHVNHSGGGSIGSNSAFGVNALVSNTTGSANTAYGQATLRYNTTGSQNTAIGNSSLRDNTIGVYNMAIGVGALQQNTTGSRNTGFGYGALLTNISGENNTAAGHQALGRTTAGDNTAFGWNAGAWVSTGTKNVLYGQGTLGDTGGSPTTGSYNSMFGNILLTTSEKTANNQVIIADGQNNRAFEKNSSGAVDIKGSSLTFNGNPIGSGTYLPLVGGTVSGDILFSPANTINVGSSSSYASNLFGYTTRTFIVRSLNSGGTAFQSSTGTNIGRWYNNGNLFVGLAPNDNGYTFEVNGIAKIGGQLTIPDATAGTSAATLGQIRQYAASATTVTANYTTGTAKTVFCQGTLTATLATTGIDDGFEYCIINETGAGTVTVNVQGGGTINGAASVTLTGAYKCMKFTKKGSNYIITGQ